MESFGWLNSWSVRIPWGLAVISLLYPPPKNVSGLPLCLPLRGKKKLANQAGHYFRWTNIFYLFICIFSILLLLFVLMDLLQEVFDVWSLIELCRKSQNEWEKSWNPKSEQSASVAWVASKHGMQWYSLYPILEILWHIITRQSTEEMSSCFVHCKY